MADGGDKEMIRTSSVETFVFSTGKKGERCKRSSEWKDVANTVESEENARDVFRAGGTKVRKASRSISARRKR